MKKLILAVCVTTCALSGFAQGPIIFNNRVSGQVVAWIYGPNPANPTEALTGNDATGTPPGTTVYGGPRLSGPGYTAQLWGGPTVDSMQPAGGFATSTFRTGAAAGLWVTSTDPAIIHGVPEGGTATLQVRAWDNQAGTITTWAEAVAAGTPLGESAIFLSQPLGGLAPPPNLIGLTSFNIFASPEPSTFALIGRGAAVLLISRRLNSRSGHG